MPSAITAAGVVAIARHLGPSRAIEVAEALAAGGIGALELTLNEPEAEALRAIEAVAIRAPGLGLEIGAGTILSVEAAGRAVDAGATFLVMPHIDRDLVAWAVERAIPVIPGCATPTEVLTAWRAGAAAVKLFPASVGGAAFVRELRGPFPEIPVVPTGGVTLETAPEFIRAGAVAVGLGSWLLGDPSATGITGRASQIVAAVATARAELAR